MTNLKKRRKLDRSEWKTAEVVTMMAMIVLHDHFGFGQKRLSRFMEEVNKQVESLERLKISDIVEEAERITGWKIQL